MNITLACTVALPQCLAEFPATDEESGTGQSSSSSVENQPTDGFQLDSELFGPSPAVRYFERAFRLFEHLSTADDADYQRALVEEFRIDSAGDADTILPLDQDLLSLLLTNGTFDAALLSDAHALAELAGRLVDGTPDPDSNFSPIESDLALRISRTANSALSVLELSSSGEYGLAPFIREIIEAILLVLRGEQYVSREGTETTNYREVVRVIKRKKDGKDLEYCSGALVKSCKVLTAQHCILSAQQTKEGAYMQVVVLGDGQLSADGRGARTFDVKSSDAHPSEDIAILTLTKQVAPAPSPLSVNTESVVKIKERSAKDPFKLYPIGFGQNSEGNSGIRRVAVMQFDGYTYMNARHTLDAELRRANYLMMAPMPPLWQTVCAGDSGGPVLADTGEGKEIVGVISASRTSVAIGTVCVSATKKQESLTWKILDVQDPEANRYATAEKACRDLGEGYGLPTSVQLRGALVANLFKTYNDAVPSERRLDPKVKGTVLPAPTNRSGAEPLDISEPRNPILLASEWRRGYFGYWVHSPQPEGKRSPARYRALLVGPFRDLRGSAGGDDWVKDENTYFPTAPFTDRPGECALSISTYDRAASVYHANQDPKDWITSRIDNDDSCKGLEEVSADSTTEISVDATSESETLPEATTTEGEPSDYVVDAPVPDSRGL